MTSLAFLLSFKFISPPEWRLLSLTVLLLPQLTSGLRLHFSPFAINSQENEVSAQGRLVVNLPFWVLIHSFGNDLSWAFICYFLPTFESLKLLFLCPHPPAPLLTAHLLIWHILCHHPNKYLAVTSLAIVIQHSDTSPALTNVPTPANLISCLRLCKMQ